jgi:glycosyltransferase involved in cell wall biosynthesis
MPFLSVAIITFNEEKNIARCLESVKKVADEIVVVDSLSADKTKSICESFGVRFIEQPFLGYIEQKNFALAQTSNDFVLSLDADEALSPELEASILQEKQRGFVSDAYSMNRRSWYCDKWIWHGNWYPDRKIRLLNKNKGQWSGTNPHDRIEMKGGSVVQHLKGDILHYTYYSIDEHIRQGNKFSGIAADAMFQKGVRSSWIKICWNPFYAFVSCYIIKLGLLDGFYGYIIAKQTAYQTFLKYIKLMQLQRNIKKQVASPTNPPAVPVNPHAKERI